MELAESAHVYADYGNRRGFGGCVDNFLLWLGRICQYASGLIFAGYMNEHGLEAGAGHAKHNKRRKRENISG